jgi:hypothetical protein
MNLEELDFFHFKVPIFASDQIFKCLGTLCLNKIGSLVNTAEVTIRTI